jgi:FkbM family methyltransferase
MKVCVVNVATHAHYPKHQRVLEATLKRHMPDAERFLFGPHHEPVPEDWPKHWDVPYGFKLYAIHKAREHGYRYVVWFDCDVQLASNAQPFLELFKRQGHYLYGGKNPLALFCNPDVMHRMGVTDKERDTVDILGGKIIAIDFENPVAKQWYDELWGAMKAGYYTGTVSASSGKIDHRGDEAIGAILADRLGLSVDRSHEIIVGDRNTPCPPGIFRSGYHTPASFPVRTVREHSIDESLLTGGAVLDGGCRDFQFAEWFADRGHPVVAIDPDPTINPKESTLMDRKPMCHFLRVALVGPNHGKQGYLNMDRDPQSRHLAAKGTPVECCTILELMEKLNIQKTQWDVVKLDIEGSEYDVLANWPGPIAKQLSVEFHEHCHPKGDGVIRQIEQHLGQWYQLVQHHKEDRHCAGFNYWDSLFVLRDL